MSELKIEVLGNSNEFVERKPFYLIDKEVLPWEKPLPKGTISLMHLFSGKTILKGYSGPDNIDKHFGNFIVRGIVERYHAEITLGGKLFRTDVEERSAESYILYDGQLMIFREGIIPGTKMKGTTFEGSGRIWLAKKRARAPSFLEDLLFQKMTEKEKIIRVEEILAGFEEIEMSRKNASTDEYFRGQRDAEESHPGTFGHRF